MFSALRPELAPQTISITLGRLTFVAGGMAEESRTEGVRRATTGPEITADDVAREVLRAVGADHDRVRVGSTAKPAWRVSRPAPRVYAWLMARRLCGAGDCGFVPGCVLAICDTEPAS
ncbi:hypothetical protein BU52_22595 [Streptomyces toyocaensis]|uniref:Uncharacterized protein n=1 Tax=Streptomyces toyocaensis TaxID=55952 RepID=A0A081XMR8_STRTO|nr:hypothetical protein BU52_22595 [Streptomyces toyocaensis]